ncbi:hypothetical protein D9M69_620300 [compost metagenome]
MLIRPIQCSVSPAGFALRSARWLRATKGSGIVTADTASSTSASGHAGVSDASAGSRRSAM